MERKKKKRQDCTEGSMCVWCEGAEGHRDGKPVLVALTPLLGV